MKQLEQITLGDRSLYVISEANVIHHHHKTHMCVCGHKSPLAVSLRLPNGEYKLLAIDEQKIDRKTVHDIVQKDDFDKIDGGQFIDSSPRQCIFVTDLLMERTMLRNSTFTTAVISALSVACVMLSGCTTTGNMERNAVIGAGLGGVTGAIIGNNTGSGDAGTGAAIGAIVGGVGGAYTGYVRDQQGHNYRTELYYDQRYNRYYYIDPHTGRSYWRNGQYRY